jgi:hypothetical protein
MTPRFPPPWSVEELEACFFVKDGAGRRRATMRPAGGCCRLSTVNAKTRGRHLIALACMAFCRKDCPVVRPFHLGGMGDLESRRPSSGGGLFTFVHAAHQRRGAMDRSE